MAKSNGGHRNGSPDAADTLTPTRLAEIGGSIPISQVQELRKIPSALPSLFPPSRVQNYFLDIASPTSLRLTWNTPASNGGSTLLGYKIRVVNQETSATVYQSATYDSSPFTATGLTTGVSYQVRVAPVNAIGQGEESYSDSIPGAIAPGAPTSLSATAGDGTAALSWTAPASDGGGAITGYVVEYTPAGGFAQTSGTGSAGTTFTLNSVNSTITNGVTYSVRVSATNAAGMGPYSSAVNVTLAAPVITITQQPVAATVTNGTGTWSVNATTTSGTLTYQWQRHTGGGNYANISGATSASYTRTQMTPNDELFTFYRCVVSCVGATSVTSDGAGFAANPTWYGNFNTPNARWTAIFGATTETSGSNASRYIGSSTGEAWDANSSPNIRTSKAGTLRITGLVSGDDALVVTNYLGYALFTEGNNSGWETTLNATIPNVIAGDSITIEGSYLAFSNLNIWIEPLSVPGAPTAVAGTAGNAQVPLTWTAPASNGGSAITGYVVEWTPSGGSATTVNTGSATASYTKTGLTNDTAYTFRVAAITSVGTGPYSSSVTVTPAAPAGAVFSNVSTTSYGAHASSSLSTSGNNTASLSISHSSSTPSGQFSVSFTLATAAVIDTPNLLFSNNPWKSELRSSVSMPGSNLDKEGYYKLGLRNNPTGNALLSYPNRLRLAAGTYTYYFEHAGGGSRSLSTTFTLSAVPTGKVFSRTNMLSFFVFDIDGLNTDQLVRPVGGYSTDLFTTPNNTATVLRFDASSGAGYEVRLFNVPQSSTAYPGWGWDSKGGFWVRTFSHGQGDVSVNVTVPPSPAYAALNFNSPSNALRITILS
jgi:hypothetical protein